MAVAVGLRCETGSRHLGRNRQRRRRQAQTAGLSEATRFGGDVLFQSTSIIGFAQGGTNDQMTNRIRGVTPPPG